MIFGTHRDARAPGRIKENTNVRNYFGNRKSSMVARGIRAPPIKKWPLLENGHFTVQKFIGSNVAEHMSVGDHSFCWNDVGSWKTVNVTLHRMWVASSFHTHTHTLKKKTKLITTRNDLYVSMGLKSVLIVCGRNSCGVSVTINSKSNDATNS